MRVGLFHNRYVHRGGEDTAVDFEVELLRKAGHDVRLLSVDNRDGIMGRRGGALRAGWYARCNPESARLVRAFLDEAPLDVAHVHNFFPLLTPAVHQVLSARGVPVVQTLHNYRLLCANAMLMRDGRPCEDCVARGPWNAVRHGCYRGSRLQTAVWADATAHHRRRGTWRECVDLFLTPSAFARRKLLAAGLPPERLRVVPHPMPDPGEPGPPGEGAIFVGRLSPEKGVDVLLDAWRGMHGYPLAIVGSGPDEEELRRRGADVAGVRFLGRVPHGRVLEAIRAARFAVMPSRWFEVSPFAALEALACGRAVVAPRDTALAESVEPGHTGLLFERGDAGDLARACRALADDASLARRLGAGARDAFLAGWGPEAAGGVEAVLREVAGRSAPRP